MGEKELIEFIRSLAGEAPPWLTVGIGDDAAVLDAPGGGRLVVTTDAVTEQVHFEPDTEPRLIGRKAVARALSDLAAMAARPLCLLASASLGPGMEEAARRALCRGLWETAEEFSAPLVGGDVSAAPRHTSVTVTALGVPGPGGVVPRSGAQVGDALCLTGRLGGSILGRHLAFTPRITEAMALVERVALHALIDISDGLSTDALHVAEASQVGLRIVEGAVPVSEDARELARDSGRDPLWHALNDGEDYELLFCLPPPQAEELVEEGLQELPVTRVGMVVEGPGSELVGPNGEGRELQPRGWEHLSE